MDFFSETLPSVVTYDAKGLVKERRILEDDASLLTSYAYNAKHQLVKEELYYLSKLMMKHDYTYRPDGQLATELFGGYGREEIKCTFMYNAEGRLNEESYSLAASGTPTVKVMYSYNKQQQLTRLSAQATYSYTNGRLSEVIYDRPSGISPNTYVMNSTFEYDADGRLRKEEVHFNNQENNAVINTFDEKGRVITQFTASNKMQQRFVYTDDEKGNWVELVYYQNDVPIALVERKITYE